jgi:geranylgeranyl diphosphate synthase type II
MLSKYQEILDKTLAEQSFDKEPKNLYQPIDYIMKLNGKRIRPLLVLFFGRCIISSTFCRNFS